MEALGLTGATKIWRRDAAALGPLDTLSPFDLAFLDPPYRKGLVAPALAGLRDGGWLNAPALVVAEMAEDETVPPTEGYDDPRRSHLWRHARGDVEIFSLAPLRESSA